MISKPPHHIRPRKTARFAEQDGMLNEQILKYLSFILLYATFMFAVFMGWMNIPAGSLSPLWALVPIFVWSVRDEGLMPSWVLFFAGILSDIVVGTPLGAHAVGFLIVAVLTRLQQRYLSTQGFLAIWIDFMMLSFLSIASISLLTIVAQAKDAAFWSIASASAMSWAVLSLAFPVLSLAAHALVNLVQRFDR